MGLLSKQAMEKANILPRLQLGIKTEKGVKSTGKHHVTLIKEELVNGKEFGSDIPIPKMRYIFEENGEQKQYDARLQNKDTKELHYFVQSMASINEGDEIIIEMVKRGPKNVIIVQKVGEKTEIVSDEEEQSEDERTVHID